MPIAHQETVVYRFGRKTAVLAAAAATLSVIYLQDVSYGGAQAASAGTDRQAGTRATNPTPPLQSVPGLVPVYIPANWSWAALGAAGRH